MLKWIHKILGLFLVKPFFRAFFKLRVTGLEHTRGLSGPLLIVSNHKFFLDSFALGAALPITRDLHPIRIMGEAQFFFNPWIRLLRGIGIIKLVYTIFGVFPAIRGSGLKVALKEPIKILKKKGVVFLHPEGKIIRENILGKFKRGASALALSTGVKVLPVAFKIKPNGFRKKYYIKFGPTFTTPKYLSYIKGAEYMRQIVAGLYKQLK